LAFSFSVGLSTSGCFFINSSAALASILAFSTGLTASGCFFISSSAALLSMLVF
jgi:hypothetical protein